MCPSPDSSSPCPILVPLADTRVVWCDGGEGLAERAAQRAAELGYSNVAVLAGGVEGWRAAGGEVYAGVKSLRPRLA